MRNHRTGTIRAMQDCACHSDKVVELIGKKALQPVLSTFHRLEGQITWTMLGDEINKKKVAVTFTWQDLA